MSDQDHSKVTAHTRQERYSQQGNPAFEAVMALRSAEVEGAFFLRHLKPGMKVIDVGCGPGSITLGFARAVAPGDVVGVDFQKSQVEQASASSKAKGVTNIRFEVADACKLPFADESLDAVFAHAVLWHLSDPARALEEFRRVLRPNGIVGIRDCDWGKRICTPTTQLLDKWWDLTVCIRQLNGGDPFFGQHIGKLLQDSGFKGIETSESSWTASAKEEVSLCASFLKAQLQGFSTTALANGLMCKDDVEAVAVEIDKWASQQDAFYSDTYCEAVGWK